jgi:hypothetical protein
MPVTATVAEAAERRWGWRDWAAGVLGVALGLPLLVYAWVGAYSRYTADDFCWAGVLRTDGFFNAQVHWYTIYSPRYAFSFLVTATELAGPAVVPALPAAAIVVWLGVLTWTFAQYGVSTLRGLVIAEVAVLATLATAPDLPQSLYWQTGMLTYLLPLIVATFLIGWMSRDTQTWWALGVSAALSFIAGGLSETYLIPQNVALTLALLVAAMFRTRRAHIAAALVGGVLALVAITVAPSTAGRVQGTPADLWLALSASIATAAFQVVRLVRQFPLVIVLCLAVPALLGSGPRHIGLRGLVLVSAVVAFTLPFCYFPSFYAQNGNPPFRSLIVPGALLVGYALVLGFALRDLATAWLPEPRRAVALLVLALVPVAAALSTLPDQAAAARYAALFDAEDQQIRASRDTGQTDLIVPRLPPNLGEDFVTADKSNWFNMCVARYYGLRTIASSTSSTD